MAFSRIYYKLLQKQYSLLNGTSYASQSETGRGNGGRRNFRNACIHHIHGTDFMLPLFFLHSYVLFFFSKQIYFKKINRLICLIGSVFCFFFWGVQLHNYASFSCSTGFGVNNDYFFKTINSLSGPLVELFVIAGAKEMLK